MRNFPKSFTAYCRADVIGETQTDFHHTRRFRSFLKILCAQKFCLLFVYDRKCFSLKEKKKKKLKRFSSLIARIIQANWSFGGKKIIDYVFSCSHNITSHEEKSKICDKTDTMTRRIISRTNDDAEMFSNFPFFFTLWCWQSPDLKTFPHFLSSIWCLLLCSAFLLPTMPNKKVVWINEFV